MDGDTTGTAGLGPTDTSGAADHPFGAGRRALEHLEKALNALEGCNKQEAQEAREQLAEARKLFEEACIVDEGG